MRLLDNPEYRARGYPYYLPARSYVMSGPDFSVVEHGDPLPGLDGRRPILAVGSNMSPQQLGRKFPDPSDVIPVTRAHLSDFDTVFSTHFTSYGAIPSTLYPSPGTVVTLFINWLSPSQEDHMHTTEVASENYRFCRLDNLMLGVENGPPLDQLFMYVSSRGALTVDGEPVPMGEASAQSRRWRAMDQDEVQDHARRQISPDQTLNAFVNQNINDASVREARTDVLHKTALPFEYENMIVLES